MYRVLLIVLLLVSPLISLVPGRPVYAWQEPVNLLQNPSFEGDYYAWLGINTAHVAHGWTPWWRPHLETDPPATYFQPEYKQANGYIFPNRVHNGAAAQQWFTFHATHQAGMYQQVFGVTPGTRYRFTVWAQVWSSTEDDASISINPAYPNLQLGIDPTGNWEPWAGTIIWSGAHAFYDSWGQLAIEAVAQSDVITVFMRSEPNFSVKHNDMYWDDAVLVAVGVGGEPVPPAATATPVEPAPPTPTCAPTPEDWVTYYVKRGDTLFSLAKNTGTTLERVISVNCLSSTDINVGQALLLPRQPATATPVPTTATPQPSRTPTAVGPATPTRTPVRTATSSPTAAPSATPSKTPIAATPTPVPAAATQTSVPSRTSEPTAVPAATATPTKPRPTLPPPSTPTPGKPAPLPTSTPMGESTRPCGTIAVGAGFVVMAGGFRFRRRKKGMGEGR